MVSGIYLVQLPKVCNDLPEEEFISDYLQAYGQRVAPFLFYADPMNATTRFGLAENILLYNNRVVAKTEMVAKTSNGPILSIEGTIPNIEDTPENDKLNLDYIIRGAEKDLNETPLAEFVRQFPEYNQDLKEGIHPGHMFIDEY